MIDVVWLAISLVAGLMVFGLPLIFLLDAEQDRRYEARINLKRRLLREYGCRDWDDLMRKHPEASSLLE